MTRTRAATAASTSAREAAFAVLLRAEAADAFAGVLLFRTLERSHLGSADRDLATAITFGVLRHRARLDHALQVCLKRPLDSLTPSIRTILRMGAYQLLHLDRVPPPVATSESVNLARRHGHAGTVRLVNAVLRRLAAEGAPPPPDPEADAIGHMAVVLSHPRWLLQRWADHWGPEEAAALAAVNLRPPPRALRANTLKITPGALLEALRVRGITARPGLIPEAIRVEGSIVERLPFVEEGLCTVQDEGAMLAALAVAPAPGDLVIDACAAPGGKTTHLAALMQNTGRLMACDVHPRKVEALAHRCAAMAADCVEAHLLDARAIGSTWAGQAGAVLVDAPCSGLGVIRRRPEIKWRIRPEALAEYAALQGEILEGTSGAVARGGALVYCVCSLEPEEGADVVTAFLQRRRDFEPVPLPASFPREVAGHRVEGAEAGQAHLFPHRHDTDGFYIARLRRR